MGTRYRRFLILSSPRSGTHLLRTALGEHPDVLSLSEVFNPDWTKGAPWDVDTPEAEILSEHVFREYPPGIRAVGFALHRLGAKFGNWPGLWDRLVADEELHVISLSRMNLLRRYLSYRVMREPKPPQPKVMRVDELREDFLRQENAIAEFLARFEAHPVLRVTYEQLTEPESRIFEAVQEFLGVDVLPLQPATSRNTRRPLAQAIANFEEIAAHFEGTRWEWCFRDDTSFQSESVTIDL